MKIINNHNVKSANYGNAIVQELLTEDKYLAKFTKIQLLGEQKLNQHVVDSYLYVLEGEGNLHIENEKVKVCKGDLLYIPKNTRHIFQGELTLLAIQAKK